MRFTLISMSVALILCCAQVSAEITIKKDFFGGWRYSRNGQFYQKVGLSGSSLTKEMKGNEEVQKLMGKYKTANIIANITAVPAGILVGAPLGAYLGSNRGWQDIYTTLIIAGAPLAIISILFESSADRNLKKAVRIYNGDEESLSFNIELAPIESGQPTTVLFRLKYGF